MEMEPRFRWFFNDNHMQLPNFVQSSRAYWRLSQGELAALVGVSQSRISRLEAGTDQPTLSVALALQIVFGYGPRATFPDLYARIEEEVMRRAADFESGLPNANDRETATKRRLLGRMMSRATDIRGA